MTDKNTKPSPQSSKDAFEHSCENCFSTRKCPLSDILLRLKESQNAQPLNGQTAPSKPTMK